MPENLSLPRLLRYVALTLGSLFFLLWLAGGLYQIRPGEAAAVQTFGAAREQPEAGEGLHWHWPSPIGRTQTLQVRKSRVAELGFHTLPEGQISRFTNENWQRDPTTAVMVTGDLNIVEVLLTGQYHIKDLNKYLFGADDPGIEFEYINADDDQRLHRSHPEGYPDGRTIQDAMEIALRQAMGTRNIDQALVSERDRIAEEVKNNAQEFLDRWQTGLLLTTVQMQEIKPPDEVQEAFDDVLRAREERETRTNQALSYRSQRLPEARGEAERTVKAAQAYHAQVTNRAQGEADAFAARRIEYETAPEIIAQRMYLETIEAVAPGLRWILNPGQAALVLQTGSGPAGTIVPLPEGPPGAAANPGPEPAEEPWTPAPMN